MTNFEAVLTRLHENLTILQEREAKYAGNAPLDLLNQIRDHQVAIALTQRAQTGTISAVEWQAALKPLLIAIDTRSDVAAVQAINLGHIEGDLVVAGRDVIQTITNVFAGDAESQRDRRNRQTMLGRVERFWIEGVLGKSVQGASLIPVQWREQPDAVDQPWAEMVNPAKLEPASSVADQSLPQLFDEADGALLILGAPGSGKTIALLELARELVNRARNDPSRPIPAVLNLSSWNGEHSTLTAWLVEELNTRYQIPTKVGRRWLENDELTLLLDGLDEVPPRHRESCAAALNQFRAEHGFCELAVCCRVDDYHTLSPKLALHRAVAITPLTPQQIDDYLDSMATPFTALRQLIKEDPELMMLARSPLVLNIMTVAYKGLSAEDLRQTGTLEDRRNHLFDRYVERMLLRRGGSTLFSAEETHRWLAWLADKMHAYGQSTFHIEGLQPTWLPVRWQSLVYHLGTRLLAVFLLLLAGGLAGGIGGSIYALFTADAKAFGVIMVTGFSFGVISSVALVVASIVGVWLPLGLTLALGVITVALPGALFLDIDRVVLAALLFGLPGALAGAALADVRYIRAAESLTWSWRKGMWGILAGVLVGVGATFLLAQINGWAISWKEVAAFGAPVAIALGLGLGLTRLETIELRTAPNEGIRRSGRNAFWVGGGIALAIVISGIIAGWGISNLVEGMAFGFVTGLPIGTAVGLYAGGGVCIQHFILRLILARCCRLPWHLSRFLDYASERIILRKVGGGYIFVHRLLLEFFSSSM